MEKTEYWLRLNAIQGLKHHELLLLAKKFCFDADYQLPTLLAYGLSLQQATQFLSVSEREIEKTFRWLEDPQHTLVTVDQALFPEQLKQIACAPIMLFVAGDPGLLATPQIAVVGSRECSHYGRHWTTMFSQALALGGLTVTSGLAYGVDSVAHRAVLTVQGKTIAVLGSGLCHIYPKSHHSLAKEIIACGGAVISEFPLFSPPVAYHFPRRNRIISGLSAGVLVIEARLKSGSLVTARHALEQNRDVFALPGSLDAPGSAGVHWLIQQGAFLVTHPNDVLGQLQSNFSWLSVAPASPSCPADETDVPLPFVPLLANVGDEVTPVDVVAERAGQPVSEIAAGLLELELAGWIAAVPGGYVRLRRACHVRCTDLSI